MIKKNLQHHYLFVILILVNIIFAVGFGSDFGESWDEYYDYKVAQRTIERYSDLEPASKIREKGPIYFVIAKIGGDWIRLINPGLSNIQSWHYINFLTFILATGAFYHICLRFLSLNSAIITTVLFNTQPLLFGHAFINHKDIPFMASFLIIVAVGLIMVDHLNDDRGKSKANPGMTNLIMSTNRDWSRLKPMQRLITAVLLFSLLLCFVIFTFKADQIQSSIHSWLSETNSKWIFYKINGLYLSIFNKAIGSHITLMDVIELYPYVYISIGIGLLFCVILLYILFFPSSFRLLSGFTTRKEFINGFSIVIRNKWVYLSGFILGISINNRSLSLAAGLFVLYFIWVKKRSLFLETLFIYFSLALLISYLTWPGLWGNPIFGLFKSLLSNSTFIWEGKVLYFGELLLPQNLPYHYLPVLMSMQFTVPVLVLFLLGIFIYLLGKKSDRYDTSLFIVFFAWIIFPLIAVFIAKPIIYDNFRHFLFITPPIFMFAGLGIQYSLSRISSKVGSLLITLVILIPGIVAVINLHPYQYIYYNEIIGGVKGSFRRFENDYWATAYLECTQYINEVAPIDATILVFGPVHIVDNYARDDINLLKFEEIIFNNDQFEKPDYVIIASRFNNDLNYFIEEETIYSVKRSGITLAVVKKLNNKTQ